MVGVGKVGEAVIVTSRGLGATPGQVVGTVGGSAASIGSSLVAAGAIAGPVGIPIMVAGAAVAVAGAMMNLFGVGVPDYTKIKASNTANEIEPYMVQNRDGYLAGERTVENQANAVATFDALWGQFVQLESDPALGEAGKRGIQERGKDGIPSWGKNWFQLYRDPIANDTSVVGSGIFDSFTGGEGGTSWVPLIVAAAAAVVIAKM
jgi:hypothetical protein